MARGACKIVSVNGALTVTFTTASGVTPVVFSDEACTTTLALPATVADGATTTFWFKSPGSYTLSVKTASGIQIAADLNTTRPIAISAGTVATYTYDTRLVSRDASGDSGRHSPGTDLSATYVPVSTPTVDAPGLGLYFPEAHGAVADGVTDDTVAIAATITAAGSRGNVFVRGNHVADTFTIVTGVRFTVVAGATITQKTASANPLIRMSGGILDGYGNLDCTNGTNSAVIIQGDDVTIKDVTITSSPAKGIVTSGARNRATIEGVRVISPTGDGIFLDNTTGADTVGHVISRCYVDKSSQAVGNTGRGIKLFGSPTNAVARSRIVDNLVLLPIGATTSSSICIETRRSHGAAICGNTTRGGYMGISIDTTQRATIDGNTVTETAKWGIELPDASYNAVTGNTITFDAVTGQAGQIAIILDGSNGPSFNTVTGNTASGYLASGTPIFCQTAVNALRNTITGNVGELPSVAGALGVRCQTGSTGVISGNSFASAGGSPFACIQLEGVTNTAVTGNLIKGWAHPVVLGTGATLSNIQVNGNTADVSPVLSTTGGPTLGTSITAYGNSDGINWLDFANSIRESSGAGSPETVVTAGIGSLYFRSNGGAATTLYVKESGTGNTGWIAK